jgi:GNAT superfamily N-acetyltransferase/predicted nucleotidyltransferase
MKPNGRDEITWGGRVPRWKIRRLYEQDAQGLVDENLLDDVGTLLYQRCRSILHVADAKAGHVHCPRCDRQNRETLIQRPHRHGDPRDALLTCPVCCWQITWGEYALSFKRHQLNPGGAIIAFSTYIQEYPRAISPQEKMLAIDRLIHEFHFSSAGQPGLPTRPVGVNLINGKLVDVIDFLDELSRAGAPGEDVRQEWDERMGIYRRTIYAPTELRSEEQLIVRLANQADIRALNVLNKKFNGVNENPEMLAERFTNPQRVEYPIIAEYYGKSVGFAALRLVPGLFYSEPQAELTELYVEEKHRRKKFGRRLVEFAEHLAIEKGAREMVVLTGSDNLTAQTFYHAFGYKYQDLALRKVFVQPTSSLNELETKAITKPIENHQQLKTFLAPLIKQMVVVDVITGILCFGSQAMGTADARSDIDLYVVCIPEIPDSKKRQRTYAQVPGLSDVLLQPDHLGWENQWSPQSDRVKLAGIDIDLSYNTLEWINLVFDQVLAIGALTLPEFHYRPYTLLGLCASALVVFEKNNVLQSLKDRLFPYPENLQKNLVKANLPILRDSLEELHNYAERGVGNTAFLFHLDRTCDALVTLAFALNEQYDPATKRVEQALEKLDKLPEQFVQRYIALIQGPFDEIGKNRTALGMKKLANELIGLIDCKVKF